jgi:hypothetical protein
MTKMKITKSQLKQIIKEEIKKILNENAGGYYIKHGSYGRKSFYDPEGNEVPDFPTDEYDDGLSAYSLVQATEKLPDFGKYMDRDKLEVGKQEVKTAGFSQTHPDADIMEDYLIPGKTWGDLFLLFLRQVRNIPDAQVVEAPEEEDEDGYGGYYGY